MLDHACHGISMAIFTLLYFGCLVWLGTVECNTYGMCRVHLSLFWMRYEHTLHVIHAGKCDCIRTRIIGIQVNAHTFIIIIFHSIYCSWWWCWVSKRRRIVPLLQPHTVCVCVSVVLYRYDSFAVGYTQHECMGILVETREEKNFSERRKH